MAPLQAGDAVPPIPGAPDRPHLVFFYKVTCPTCRMAAPVAERLHRTFPGRFVAVGQDPPERLEAFAREFDASFDAVSDAPPYETSDPYGIRTVPTLFVVDEGRVVDSVESWDRDGWNALATRFGDLVGTPVQAVSSEGDGLPPFRPG